MRRQQELFHSVPAWQRLGTSTTPGSRRSATGPGTPLIRSTCLSHGKEGVARGLMGQAPQQRARFADPDHPFRLQGSADLNSYKMFAEFFWNLLSERRLGVSSRPASTPISAPRICESSFFNEADLNFWLPRQNLWVVFAQNAVKVTGFTVFCRVLGAGGIEFRILGSVSSITLHIPGARIT